MASTALDLRGLCVMSADDYVCKDAAYPAAWTHRMPMSRPIDGERAAPMDPPTKRAIDIRYTICKAMNHNHSTLAYLCCRRTWRPLSSLSTLQKRGMTP